MNTDSTPFFSVVIPTRNRAKMAADLLRSALRQDFTDCEIVLIDNSENDDTRQAVQGFEDERFRYERSGGLSMVDNWNRALDAASGEYVLLLPDRHVFIARDRLRILQRVLKAGEIPVLTWPRAATDPRTHVFWPLKGNGKMRCLTSQQFVKALCGADNHIYYSCLPRGMNSCIRRDVLQRLRDRFGRVALPDSPDFGIGFPMVYLGMDVSYWDTTITAHYGRAVSNGHVNRSDPQQCVRWAQQFPRLHDYLLEHAPFPVVTVENTVLNMFFYWSEMEGYSHRWSDMERGPYFGRIYQDIMRCENPELRENLRREWDERLGREERSVQRMAQAKAKRVDRKLKRKKNRPSLSLTERLVRTAGWRKDRGEDSERSDAGGGYDGILEAVAAFEQTHLSE